MGTSSQIQNRWAVPDRQRGMVATLVAIIVLVATLIAAAALVISVDTSNQIAGNLAFRQGLIQESERAYATVQNSTTFAFDAPADINDIPSSGYYAEIQPHTKRADIPDLLSSNPPGGVALPAGTTGNAVHYVIERLCIAAGPAVLSGCEVPTASTTGGTVSNQTGDQGNTNFQPGLPVAYRLTVRVDGPRNAIGYMQTVLR